jgi:hypothetical protein
VSEKIEAGEKDNGEMLRAGGALRHLGNGRNN